MNEPISNNEFDSDDLTDDEEEANSTDEETEEKFHEYLKSKSLLNKPKPATQKDVAEEFENEMEKDLDDLIGQEHQVYLKKLDELKKNEDKVNEDEEEDTDSEAELETGVRCTKKRPHFTPDELFYDPTLDDEDQNWLNKHRKTCKKVVSPARNTSNLIPKSILKPTAASSSAADQPVAASTSKTTYADAKTDAILNCPCCMTMLTMDCQRHEEYKTQYRAMFVFNCKIKQDEILKVPLSDEMQNKKKKFKKSKKKQLEEMKNEVADEEENKLKADPQQFESYKPVICEICGVEVGVYDDKDEVYHFFNVLASHS